MLDPVKSKVCEMLGVGTSVIEVAKATGVSRQTIYDWKKLPEVKARLDLLGQEYLSATVAMMQVEGPKSMKVLIKLRDTAESEKVRLEACKTIMDKLVSNAVKIDIGSGRDTADVISVDVLVAEMAEFAKLSKEVEQIE